MLEALRRQIRAADQGVPIMNVKTLVQHRDSSIMLWAVNTGARLDSAQTTPQAGTVKSMAGEAPRQQGYTNYLRSPGLTEMAGAALPGVAGILLMTLGGGVVGYRQANAGRMVRTTAAARYLP